jgi:hypothetical protein
MSSQIDVARVLQFKNNLIHLSQQKGSRLRNSVMVEMVTGKSHFFERLGAATAVEKTSRHADTPQIDSAHTRRKVDLRDYHWADMVDIEDQIKMLIDPTSKYAEAAMYSLGRKIDDVIVAAAVGNAYTGEAGSSTSALGTGQKVVPVSGGSATNLNLDSLLKAKNILDSADVDPDLPRYIAVNSSAIMSLLNEDELTSADYNTVKALVQGKIDTFLGFKFIQTQRVNQITPLSHLYSTTTGLYDSGGSNVTSLTSGKSMVCWAQGGLGLAMGKDMNVKIDPRVDKSYAMQVYAQGSWGATRVEDEKVVEIICSQ